MEKEKNIIRMEILNMKVILLMINLLEKENSIKNYNSLKKLNNDSLNDLNK